MKTAIRWLRLGAALVAAGQLLMVPAHAREATVRIAYNLPADHATGVYFETLAKEIEARTAGTALTLKARTFPNGQLYNDTTLPDAVGQGGVEIGQMNIGFITGPDAEPLRIWGLPWLYDSWEAAWATEDNPNFRGVIQAQFRKFNMQMLGWAAYGTVEFYAKRPINTPADMKGMRMRAFGVDTSQLLKAVGASPVSMSSQEMFQAVQRGVIDGFITGPTSVYARKLYEGVGHGTSLDINYLSFLAAANLEWLNGLPADTRAAVLAASDVAQKASRLRAQQDDSKARAQLAQLGLKASPAPTPAVRAQWVDASKPLYDQYLGKSGRTGAELMAIVKAANAAHPAR
jgi:C4-dicarboxylate-binding protein DctP